MFKRTSLFALVAVAVVASAASPASARGFGGGGHGGGGHGGGGRVGGGHAMSHVGGRNHTMGHVGMARAHGGAGKVWGSKGGNKPWGGKKPWGNHKVWGSHKPWGGHWPHKQVWAKHWHPWHYRWHRPVVYGSYATYSAPTYVAPSYSEPTYTAPAAYSAPEAAPVASNCNCLTKRYEDGAVIFEDVCTHEGAMSSPQDQAQAQ